MNCKKNLPTRPQFLTVREMQRVSCGVRGDEAEDIVQEVIRIGDAKRRRRRFEVIEEMRSLLPFALAGTNDPPSRDFLSAFAGANRPLGTGHPAACGAVLSGRCSSGHIMKTALILFGRALKSCKASWPKRDHFLCTSSCRS